MTARWANEGAGRTCTKCGVHAEAGRIFCANCGAALQTPLPQIRATVEDYSSPSRTMRPTRSTVVRSFLLGFPLSVVLDIVLGTIIPDHLIRLVLVFIVPVLVVGILLVASGTVGKNQWGINTEPVNCPACGCPMPQVRQPKSIKQALWGGGICGKCGCEMDKWGRLTALAR
jgi:transcription elongation factor Elf1